MNWKAFRRTTLGMIAAIGIGAMFAILIQAGLKDFFGLSMSSKVAAALSFIGIVGKWGWDYIREYQKQLKEKIDKKLDAEEFKQYKEAEKDKTDEMFAMLQHISDRIDKLTK